MTDFSDWHRTIDWAKTEQQCPDCGEWYKISHSTPLDEWDAEAQREHEDFCVALLEELGYEPDYELLRQERLIDGEV